MNFNKKEIIIGHYQSMERQGSFQETNQNYKDKILKLLGLNENKILPHTEVERINLKIERAFPKIENNCLEIQSSAPNCTNNENDVSIPTEEQLCDILSTIKQLNKKTSIQLAIKIIYEIVCAKDSVSQCKIKSSLKQKKYSRFQRYDKRLKSYTTNVQNTRLLHTKSESKIECKIRTSNQRSLITELSSKRFLQFSTPSHVLQYFRYQLASFMSVKHIQQEPFSQRLSEFHLFKAQGHLSTEYNNERKTAKIFCLVGPGVRPARQFFGQDLGPNSHCKTVSRIVKIAYRELECYINQMLSYFSNLSQENGILSHNQKGLNGQEQLPTYFASRRQLSRLKTPLFNCRNWMNDEQLELFLMFVKKAYRIVYNKQWLIEKRREIFILFGRIIKKLLQREILIRNFEVLKGNDEVKLRQGQQYFGIQTDQGLIRLSKRQMESFHRRNQRKLQHKLNQQINSKHQLQITEQELFKDKYQQLVGSFRSNQ